MYCKNCGATLLDGAEFCTDCGVLVGNGDAYCPECGVKNVNGKNFCSKCGASFLNDNAVLIKSDESTSKVNKNTPSEVTAQKKSFFKKIISMFQDDKIEEVESQDDEEIHIDTALSELSDVEKAKLIEIKSLGMPEKARLMLDTSYSLLDDFLSAENPVIKNACVEKLNSFRIKAKLEYADYSNNYKDRCLYKNVLKVCKEVKKNARPKKRSVWPGLKGLYRLIGFSVFCITVLMIVVAISC